MSDEKIMRRPSTADPAFNQAYLKMMKLEGGFVLHNVPGDPGGQTFAGISRRAWPEWEGWPIVERNPEDAQLTNMVLQFYLQEYWEKNSLHLLESPVIGAEMFVFSVNAGLGVAARLAQIIVKETPDGIMGPKTIGKINTDYRENSNGFVMRYKLGMIARYRDIVTRDKSLRKFLLGWINRALA